MDPERADRLVDAWLAALDVRHLAHLTTSETARALRALSSCYVERRSKLAAGGALGTAGKRAAFALFYGPLHFFVARDILRSLPSARDPVRDVIDLGCGTGVVGAAWGLEADARGIRGVDRNPWAVAEANWTYRQLHLNGRAAQRDVARRESATIKVRPGTAVVAAYLANELGPEGRGTLLSELLEAHARGARVLVIEPVSRRVSPWWEAWQRSFERVNGRADEWRFSGVLPPTQLALARAAGLDPRELTARTLWLRGRESPVFP
jgi:hypothetical protein